MLDSVHLCKPLVAPHKDSRAVAHIFGSCKHPLAGSSAKYLTKLKVHQEKNTTPYLWSRAIKNPKGK